jgi:hypothetical protein
MRTPPPCHGAPANLMIRIAWGVALITAPRRMLRLGGGPAGERGSDWVVRILGARHLVQAATSALLGKRAKRFGLAADLLHAASDLCLAHFDPRWRHAALSDAAIAAGFICVDVANLGGSPERGQSGTQACP